MPKDLHVFEERDASGFLNPRILRSKSGGRQGKVRGNLQSLHCSQYGSERLCPLSLADRIIDIPYSNRQERMLTWLILTRLIKLSDGSLFQTRVNIN